MFDLIHRRNLTAETLTIEQVQELCPAAFTDHASPELSERYGFVSSANAIAILADHGFAPTRAAQKPVRKAADLPFADHMLTFRPLNGYSDETETAPEIVLYNSHNGKSALKLYCGCYRFICGNGVVAGDGFEAKMRHSRLTANAFSDMVAEQAQTLPALMQNIERMRATQWGQDVARDFILQAAPLRWEGDPETHDWGREYTGELRGSFSNGYTLRDLNAATRYGDAGGDAWRTFNRVQEGLIRGGVRIRSYTDRNPYGKTRRARAVASLPETVRINRQLWDMANAVA
jgi:hypothetical protein